MNEQPDLTTAAGNGNGRPTANFHRNGETDSLPPDYWSFLEILLHHWTWLATGGTVLGLLGLAMGWHLWKSTCTAPAQLIAYNSPSATEIFGERQISPQTIVSVLRSPELLQAAGAQARPPVSAATLNERLSVMPDHNSDIIVVTVTASGPQNAMELVNRYADEAVRFTKKLQAASAAEMNTFFAQQLARVDTDIAALDRQARFLPATGATAGLAPAANPLVEELQAAQQHLIELLGTYTQASLPVQSQRAKIAALEHEFELASNPAATNAIGGTTNSNPGIISATGENDPAVVRGKLESLESSRLALLGKQQAVLSFAADPPGYCRLLAPATLRDVVVHGRAAKVLSLAVFLGLLGLFGTAATILLAEFMDDRLKTADDVRRVVKLPVLTTAGDLSGLNENTRRDWAFRAWTDLQGRLSPSPNHGLICGVTSCGHKEGRSTWVYSLAEAASQLGFRVLTIATRPSPNDTEAPDVEVEVPPTEIEPPLAAYVSLTPNILAKPGEVTEQLTGPNPQPIVHIPLPGWVWNLERRKQWQEALKHWAQIDNIVILVELPPASLPEAVLLAQNLPNVVWLTDCGKANAAQSRERLETLRSARCHLAGAVLNHAPASALKRRFSRWAPA
jgi:capsular polysaccharide biosynthesis protein